MPRLLKNAMHATLHMVQQVASGGGSSLGYRVEAGLLELLYPPRCGCCGHPLLSAGDQKVCGPCREQVYFIDSPLCLCCGAGLSLDGGSQDRYCRSCLKALPLFDMARSLVYYRGPVRTLLHHLKFKADTRAAAVLGSLIENRERPFSTRLHDLIIPIPLHRARLQKRGLNQSLVLARMLFTDEDEKIRPTTLIRVKNTVAQTQLSGPERRKNLRGAFEVNPRIDPVGKKICLVDDIFTTGTTVTECTMILKRNGAAAVDVLTFARA